MLEWKSEALKYIKNARDSYERSITDLVKKEKYMTLRNSEDIIQKDNLIILQDYYIAKEMRQCFAPKYPATQEEILYKMRVNRICRDIRN